MARIVDIIERMEDKPVRVSISNRKDRLDNKESWKYYGERIHRSKSNGGYKLSEWEDVNKYIWEHEYDE